MKLLKHFLGFHFLFYKGSHVTEETYKPLQKQLELKIPIDSFQFHDSSNLNENEKETVFIAHSFGGYFAMNDCLKNNTNIDALILINSHSNIAKRAIYPSIDEGKLQIPTLFITAENDSRLPLENVVSDMWEMIEKENLKNSRYIFFNDWNHFDAFSENNVEKVSLIIRDFLEQHTNDSLYMQKKNEALQKYGFETKYFTPHYISFDYTLNMFDYLLKLNIPRVHFIWIHNLLFLYSKPSEFFNYGFTDFTNSILLKTKNVISSDIERNYQKQIFSDNVKEKIIFHRIPLPMNIFGLYTWLFGIPPITKKHGHVHIFYFMLPLPDNVFYYKLPSYSRTLRKFYF